MSGAQPLSDEMRFVVDRLVEKVFQGDERKRGLATNCASVAIAALQDHVAATIGALDDGEVVIGNEVVRFDPEVISLIQMVVNRRPPRYPSLRFDEEV